MIEKAKKYLQLMDRTFYKSYGKVAKVVGLTIESVGPKARLGDLCRIYPGEDQKEQVRPRGLPVTDEADQQARRTRQDNRHDPGNLCC